MSTIKPVNSPNTQLPKSTYGPINYWKLIAIGPAEYCRVMQQRECKVRPSDPVLRNKCLEMYRECLIKATLYEQWSNMHWLT